MGAWPWLLLMMITISLLTLCESEETVDLNQSIPIKPQHLPEEFIAYKDKIEQSKRHFIRVTPKISATLKVKQSKFLGTPFLPEGRQYPKNIEGKNLVLLAQINFDEVPNLQNFPENGILQFYIDPGVAEEHVWGMNNYQGKPWKYDEYFQTLQNQDYFRVIYIPADLVNSPASEDKYVPYTGYGMPISDQMELEFELDSEYVNVEDYQFQRYIGLNRQEFYDKHSDLNWQTLDAFYQYLLPDAIAKIGGYGRFTQNDPRSESLDDEWLILLNIESSSVGKAEILWGDNGIASFFIKRQDLKNLDFTKVAYYWDNH